MIELRVNSGLCNRMRAISSALALSRAAGRQLRIYWFNTRALKCPFAKLFEPIDGVEVVDVATGRLRALWSTGAWRLKVAGRRTPYDLFLSGDKIKELEDKDVDLADVVSQAERCGIETYGRFYGEPPYHGDLVPRRELAAEAEGTFAAATAGGGGRTVGVHIRRGDNDASIQISPVDLFVKRMEQEVGRDPEVRFFLSTDDQDTEEAMTRLFPGRVTVRPKDFSRTSTRGVQDALVDLLVLSKCPLILGSYWSSFSQTAAEIGGATLETMVTSG